MSGLTDEEFSMLDLRGKTVIITGGATGIGFGLAKTCGERGANRATPTCHL